MRYLLYFLSVFSLNVGNAQNPFIDSVRQMTQPVHPIKDRVDSYFLMSKIYLSMGRIDEVLQFADTLMDCSVKEKFAPGEAYYYSILGMIHSVNGLNDSALVLFKKAIIIQERCQDRNGLAGTYGNLGKIYLDMTNFPMALDYFLKALSIFEETGNLPAVAKAYNNMAIIHSIMDDFDKALAYYEKSLEIRLKTNDLREIPTSLQNIGLIHSATKEFEKALPYFRQAETRLKGFNDQSNLASVYVNFGATYRNMGLLDSALHYQQKAYELSKMLNKSSTIATSATGLAGIYYDLGNYEMAEYFGLEGRKIAQMTGAKDAEHVVLNTLRLIYEERGQWQQALEFTKLYFAAKDSIFNEKNQSEITRKEMQFEFDKVQEQQRAEQAMQDLVNKEEAKRQRLVIVSMTGVLVLVSLLTVMIFRNLQRKKQANIIITQQKEAVEEQKAIVEEKNTEILASIRYARTIQNTLLPSVKLVKEYLQESFVLYLPKDIVSGDFYWMESKNGKVFFAAADCTGHGVPGAMVSVLGNNALGKVVNEMKIEEPAAILNHVNEVVEQYFEKSENEVKDGMDIALCSLEEQNNTYILQYAGANNPLWIVSPRSFASKVVDGKNIHSGGEEEIEISLYEIKANKQPIGKFENRQPFTNHHIELKKGDCVYIFSDGLADQFGGEKGKKFKYSQFRSWLVAHNELEMPTQKEQLHKCYEDWMGDLEQVDDVCVIGIRI